MSVRFKCRSACHASDALGKRADVAVAARARWHLQIQRDAIHAVVKTFAPDEIATRGELHGFREREFNAGLQVHQVLRADERRFVEISAARKERVERAEI